MDADEQDDGLVDITELDDDESADEQGVDTAAVPLNRYAHEIPQPQPQPPPDDPIVAKYARPLVRIT